MKNVRLIARLDVKPPHVIKGVHFEGLRKVGTPEELARKYYEQGADEIFYVDCVASLYRREILYDFVSDSDGSLYLNFYQQVHSVEDSIFGYWLAGSHTHQRKMTVSNLHSGGQCSLRIENLFLRIF